MVDELLEDRQNDGGWNTTEVPDDYLLGLFLGQLKRSREAWSKAQPRFSEERRREETEEEVVDRFTSYESKRSKAVGSRARRQHVSLLSPTHINLSIRV